MANKKFQCSVCGYIYEGEKPPKICPVCGADASKFVELKDKKELNTNSNAYIMVYTTVIVVIVALMLALTYSVLNNRMENNVRLDKKKQILSSLPAVNVEGGNVSKLYNEYIKEYVMLDSNGQVTKTVDNFDYEPSKSELPMYVAEVNGEVKYIIPLYGKGLWGAIWGYIALNSDKNTVYGVYYSDDSETPGLGAEIATKKFQNQFQGKHIMYNGGFASIAVEKGGKVAANQDQVDAISGATITSKGVQSMLYDCMAKYNAFFTNKDTLTVGGNK